MNITVMLVGVIGIYIGGNWMVSGISRLARSYRIPQVIVGLTIISLVTSTPELLISVQASIEGADGLIFGTLTGSNIANIALILGLSGLFHGAMPIASVLVRRGVPVMVGLIVLVYGVIFLPAITWWMGLILIAAFVVFYVYILRIVRSDIVIKQLVTQEMAVADLLQTSDALLTEDENIVEKEIREKINRPFELVRTIAGIIALIIGSDALVTGVLSIVTQVGTNEVILGATFVALVTSLPELVAISAATNRDQPDVAFGNLIGSSTANILLVLGAAALVQPLTAAFRVRVYEYPVMLALMVYLIYVAVDGKLSRFEAGLFSLAYVAFIAGFFLLPI